MTSAVGAREIFCYFCQATGANSRCGRSDHRIHAASSFHPDPWFSEVHDTCLWKATSGTAVVGQFLGKLTVTLQSCNIQDTMAERNNVIHATINLWSSRNMKPIIGVKFHYFDTKFKSVVKTAAFRHFGNGIRQRISQWPLR